MVSIRHNHCFAVKCLLSCYEFIVHAVKEPAQKLSRAVDEERGLTSAAPRSETLFEFSLLLYVQYEVTQATSLVIDIDLLTHFIRSFISQSII